MANVQAAVHAYASELESAAWLCGKVNKLLYEKAIERFVTFFYGVLDGNARTLRYCNAGYFWMGHGDVSVGDLYDKMKEDVEFPKEWVEKCGFGFELSPVVPNVPNVPRNEEIDAVKKAA
jgi:hypothetical protein